MTMRTSLVTKVICLVLLNVFSAVWADYEAGQRAWEAGRLEQALAEWRAVADGGDRRAMLALGRLYAQGLGVLQDYVEAHKWFNLAASRGEEEAVQERDALAAKMTPQQIATAQERATAWQPRASSVQEVSDAPVAAAEPPPPRAIREAQELLAALGYAPGPADGIWGDRSARAYRSFLRDVGRPESDMLEPEALRAMREIVKRRGGMASVREEAPRRVPESRASRPVRVRPDALHRATQSGDMDGLKAALAGGLEVDGRDRQSWTALMHAANKGYPPLVKLLLAAHADPDGRAPDGATALFIAALHGHTEIIELLMEAGADITLRGPQGKTASEVARKHYGDADAARKNDAGPAVLALLRGMTLEEQRLTEERRRQEETNREEARKRQEADDTAFTQAKATGTAAAYRKYLSSFPQGHHANNARRLQAQAEEAEKDDAAYTRAHSAGTAAAYRKYLSSYPRGRHASSAKRLMQEIYKREEARRKLEKLGLVMVRVEGGSFTMGCKNGRDANCYADEIPAHQVRLSSFEIGKYEVTYGLWRAVMGGRGQGWQQYPIVVNWYDVQKFLKRLNAQTGGKYRLPTEAEWEYAARGGQRSRGYQYAGSNRKASVAWCSPISNNLSGVGQKQPNELGLFDMSGNVAEWVQDWYGDYSSGPVTDPLGPNSGSYRVIRGGSVFTNARFCRVAMRLYASPDQDRCFSKCYVGFRLVRVP